jgi:para-nitrobenzyl esterase
MEVQIIAPPEPEPQDEDCLYLNIWTPGLDDARRPVMVWIHGGAFVNGSGSSLMYNGRTLSTRGNTVIVTINYRLGTLGFLNLNEVTGGRIPATGNEGLLDQVFALAWVHDNIAAFGGDQNNVTIFGESAGGMSVGALLAMPKARGLFHKAIPQSGAAHSVSSMERAVRVTKALLDILGMSPNDTDGLRSLTVKRLLDVHKELAARALDWRSGLGGLPLQPVVDGKVLPHLPISAIANGSADNIPILVGTTLEEARLFNIMDPNISKMDEARLLRRCQRLVPTVDAASLVETYRKARDKRAMSTTPAELLMAMQTDKAFRIPAVRLAESHSRRRQPTYAYLFTWKSPAMGGTLGACHAIDLGFVFGTYEARFSGTGPAADALAGKTQDAWLAFARTGNPSTKSLGKWPQYGTNHETMFLGAECHVVKDPFAEENRAWEPVPDAVLGVF